MLITIQLFGTKYTHKTIHHKLKSFQNFAYHSGYSYFLRRNILMLATLGVCNTACNK